MPSEVLEFPGRSVGQRVLIYDELPSTNDTLATMPAEPGLVVVARHQTAGRGTQNRTWVDEPNASLLLSLRIDLPTELRRPVLLTAWAAVAIAEAIEKLTQQQASIKWPNDLLLGGKKVCGILIEQRPALIVGLGLNLNQSTEFFDTRKLSQATSLALHTKQDIYWQSALEVVLNCLNVGYTHLVNGSFEDLQSQWIWRTGLLGRQVVLELLDGSLHMGRLHDMTFAVMELHEATHGAYTAYPVEQVRHVFPCG